MAQKVDMSAEFRAGGMNLRTFASQARLRLGARRGSCCDWGWQVRWPISVEHGFQWMDVTKGVAIENGGLRPAERGPALFHVPSGGAMGWGG